MQEKWNGEEIKVHAREAYLEASKLFTRTKGISVWSFLMHEGSIIHYDLCHFENSLSMTSLKFLLPFATRLRFILKFCFQAFFYFLLKLCLDFKWKTALKKRLKVEINT